MKYSDFVSQVILNIKAKPFDKDIYFICNIADNVRHTDVGLLKKHRARLKRYLLRFYNKHTDSACKDLPLSFTPALTKAGYFIDQKTGYLVKANVALVALLEDYLVSVKRYEHSVERRIQLKGYF